MYKNIAGVHNISLRFGENTLFSGFSLDIPAGQVTGLSGPSGRGKTTLLRILSGLCEPDSGDIVRNYSRHAYVFQDHRLFPWMSALENIALPLRKKHGEKSADIAEKYLERVHLKDCGGLRPHQLSGGMAQRVSLARALAFQPDIIYMDEPFSALDYDMRILMCDTVKEYKEKNGTAMVYVSHHPDDLHRLADRVIKL